MSAETPNGQGGIPDQVVTQDILLPYNANSERRIITPRDRVVGPKIRKIYDEQVHRSHPAFDILDKQILVYRTLPNVVATGHLPGDLPIFDVQARTIETGNLEHERDLSRPFVRTLGKYAWTEKHLTDFMALAVPLFDGNPGVTAAYMQWGREELQHGMALDLILEKTGQKTEDELDEAHMSALEQTWELPFPTGRQMIIYAALQERLTRDAYVALAKHAREQEHAPTVARILDLISRDEAYHGGGYMKFAKVYYEYDPEGTVRDALHVAENFEMPVARIIPDQRRSFVDAVRVGAFAPDMGAGTIHKTLLQLGFIDPRDAKRAADAYGERRVLAIQSKGVLESGLLLAGKAIDLGSK